jgi:hypothetical protein
MKALLLIPIIALPVLFSACETTVVARRPVQPVYVERDDYYYRTHPRVHRPYRRDVVVVNPRPAYRPQVEVRYYNDARGRYYFKGGRRVYVNAGVYY